MAHEVYMLSDGRYSMAFTGNPPWHGLGQQVPDGASIEEWIQIAGLDWSVVNKTVHFRSLLEPWEFIPFHERQVIVRTDNMKPLSVVSDEYMIVQPREILQFYRDLAEENKVRIETAGSLKEGKRVWALANWGMEANVGDDKSKLYMLLVTSYDGTLATTAKLTSVRVVCNNTLTMAMDRDSGRTNTVKIVHRSEFDPKKVTLQLAAYNARFVEYMGLADELRKYKMSEEEMMKFYMKVFLKTEKWPVDEVGNPQPLSRMRTMNKVFATHQFTKREMPNVEDRDNNLWVGLNTVTRFVDHVRGKSDDTRMDSAWFGQGEAIKLEAVRVATEQLAA